MKPAEIESWALRIIEIVKKGGSVEDVRVELKADWPDTAKAARRLAGHANSARSEHILWLIGVDEKKGVVGANYQELSTWFSLVRSAFDGVAPAMQNLNVQSDGFTIAALAFDTTRAPFVVRNPAYGKTPGEVAEWEVPWREGTMVRSARRNDLILVLSPIAKIPKLQIISGVIKLQQEQVAADKSTAVVFSTIYVVPSGPELIVFPFHRCSASIVAKGAIIADSVIFDMKPSPRSRSDDSMRFLVSRARRLHDERSPTYVRVKSGVEIIEATDNDILIRGPGMIDLRAEFVVPTRLKDEMETELRFLFFEALNDSRISLDSGVFSRWSREGEFGWTLS